MLRTSTERAVAGIAVILGLGLLPVLPAGVPVLVAALAAPAVLCAEGRRAARRATGKNPQEDPQKADGRQGEGR